MLCDNASGYTNCLIAVQTVNLLQIIGNLLMIWVKLRRLYRFWILPLLFLLLLRSLLRLFLSRFFRGRFLGIHGPIVVDRIRSRTWPRVSLTVPTMTSCDPR